MDFSISTYGRYFNNSQPTHLGHRLYFNAASVFFTDAVFLGAFTQRFHVQKVGLLSFKRELASDGSVNTLASDHF